MQTFQRLCSLKYLVDNSLEYTKQIQNSLSSQPSQLRFCLLLFVSL